MKFLNGVFHFLFNLLKIIFFQWFRSLRIVFSRLFEIIEESLRQSKVPKRERKAAENRCVPINEPAYEKPDPLIYPQFYLMRLGFAVTWDNPDIVFEEGGIPVPSANLKRNTTYDIVARIWNNALTAPVVGLPVYFSYLSFGIGIKSNPIGDTKVVLGVKGGSNHPAFARMKWTTPDDDGHYCIQVLLDWIDDANPENNLGQENTFVGTAHSPAESIFRLRNSMREIQVFRFEVDTYSIPELPLCREELPPGKSPNTSALTNNMLHNRKTYPVPEGWVVLFTPNEPILQPGEEISIKVHITPPHSFIGRQAFNINGFSKDRFAGGITLYIEKEA